MKLLATKFGLFHFPGPWALGLYRSFDFKFIWPFFISDDLAVYEIAYGKVLILNLSGPGNPGLNRCLKFTISFWF